MKYLLLKHYRGGPEPVEGWTTMDRWTPDEGRVQPVIATRPV
jgi:hypothetical protein